MADESVTLYAWINGKRVDADEYMERENPADPQKTVAYVPKTTTGQAAEAIEAARAAFPAWKEVPVEERIERMERAIQTLKDRTPELAETLAEEHGKPIYDAQGEMAVSIMWMEHACQTVKETIADQVDEGEGGKTIVRQEPIGVVSAISPWNYPIALSTIKIAPAILTGNTVVSKPSPFAPHAVSLVVEMMAGEFPDGVLNLVHGEAEVGVELTSNKHVDKIAFTGGTETAKKIMKSAADTIKDMTLELGGNDAAVVLPDFDVNDERAMRRMVISNFLTAGQICMIAKRIYVPRTLYNEFVEKYQEAANKWVKIGSPFDEQVTTGPLNNKQQLDFVKNLVDKAAEKGADVIPLGHIVDNELFEQGYFLQPTLVLGADQQDDIVKEEQFGPTVPIVPYDTVDEAVAMANDSIYGLTSSVWGEENHAIEVAARIEAGTTMVNTAAVQGLDVRYPFGGVKQSGIGREYGKEGLLGYVTPHVINVPKMRDLPYIPE